MDAKLVILNPEIAVVDFRSGKTPSSPIQWVCFSRRQTLSGTTLKILLTGGRGTRKRYAPRITPKLGGFFCCACQGVILTWLWQIWGLYAAELGDLAKPENKEQAIKCLNHMVTNALGHMPDVFTFMSRLKNPTVFAFCAIPQVMAVSTLERLYNNHNVFRGVVKIRKGTAVQLMLHSTSYSDMLSVFESYVLRLEGRLKSVTAGSTEETQKQVAAAKKIIVQARRDGVLTGRPMASDSLMRTSMLAGAAAAAVYCWYNCSCNGGVSM